MDFDSPFPFDHPAPRRSIDQEGALRLKEHCITNLSAQLNNTQRAAVEVTQAAEALRAENEALRAENERLQLELTTILDAKSKEPKRVAGALAKLILRAPGEAAKLDILTKLYQEIGNNNSRHNRKLWRDVGNRDCAETGETQSDCAETGEKTQSLIDGAVALVDTELGRLRSHLVDRHEKMSQKNDGRKGVLAYVGNDGLLEPVDIEADLLLKRTEAPNFMALMEGLLTTASWRREQSKAEWCLAAGLPYWDRRKQENLTKELASFVRGRAKDLAGVLCFASDYVINARANGAQTILTPLLLSLSVSRQVSGQSEHSAAHDCAVRLGTSHGTTWKLLDELATRYLESYPAKLAQLFDGSRVLSRDSSQAPLYDRARSLVRLRDNYVKALLRRTLQSDGNFHTLDTESGLWGAPPENLLKHPELRTHAVNEPYADDIIARFSASTKGFAASSTSADQQQDLGDSKWAAARLSPMAGFLTSGTRRDFRTSWCSRRANRAARAVSTT